jgi:hypothetical protein
VSVIVPSDAVNIGTATQNEGRPLVLSRKSPPSASCWGGLVGWLVGYMDYESSRTHIGKELSSMVMNVGQMVCFAGMLLFVSFLCMI